MLVSLPLLAACGESGVCSSPQTTTLPTTTPSVTTTPPQGHFEVYISDLAFIPETITVPAGATVIWINLDSRVYFIDSENDYFPYVRLDPGASSSYTFTEPGVFGYHLDEGEFICGPEPPSGKIIVE